MRLGDRPPGYRSGFVCIVGRPNVGKSTLLNQIIRSKVAITSSRPQTTRNAIRGVYTAPDVQIVFVDTPGLHKPHSALGTRLNRVVRNTLSEVEAVLFVVDAADGIGSGDAFIAKELREVSTPVVVALNKVDGMGVEAVSRQHQAAMALAGSGDGGAWETFPISARTGQGIDVLLGALRDAMPEGPLFYPPDVRSDQPERQVIAELIREKVLDLTREEVPHSVAVVIEEIREGTDDTDTIEIDAIVFVERDAQKPIVIGRGGRVLKQVGTRARREIEALLGSHVYLHLRVKVERDWQRRDDLVARFGYGE